MRRSVRECARSRRPCADVVCLAERSGGERRGEPMGYSLGLSWRDAVETYGPPYDTAAVRAACKDAWAQHEEEREDALR